jgi:hypothetical protein
MPVIASGSESRLQPDLCSGETRISRINTNFAEERESQALLRDAATAICIDRTLEDELNLGQPNA